MTNNNQNTLASDAGFDVILQDIGHHKINVIKEVKKITSLGLREVKEMVEDTPSIVLEGVAKDEADAIKVRLEKVGAIAEVVSHTTAPAPALAVSGLTGGQPSTPSNPSNAKAAAIDAALKRMDGISKGLLVKREIKELPSILWEGELPEMLASGFYNNGTGILVATDRRVVFVDKGMLGSLKIEDFPYDKISSIESKTGMVAGEITIFVSGNKELIKSVPKDQARALADFLRNKVFLASNKSQASVPAEVYPVPATSNPSVMPAASIADELEKFANLRDRGIITEEEFNTQKARLLQ